MTNGKLNFRIATLDDAAQLQPLVENAFRAEDSRKDWTADMVLSEDFRLDIKDMIKKIVDPDSATLMATDDSNALVGSISVFKLSPDVARLSLLAVDQTYQRGGLGRQILAHAEDYCQRTWGVKTFGLNALSTREQLISWYVRCGYRKTGETSPFPYELMEGRVLPEGLFFVELEKDSGVLLPTGAGDV
ncbi:hypothetical protein AK830_g9656 [Neonectria ditissima]|uniref:N-acetyltransferase domain-containing protein n=1 Tax=Neonectria ditissima TaxID=78410 RepID=A0A0P7B993_9HYPO|nr:hypothetical protein AK830_g9656 [Neonectria ditissima]